MKAFSGMTLLGFACATCSTEAFQPRTSISFVGRNIFPFPEFQAMQLRRTNGRVDSPLRHTSMNMPPFLKKLRMRGRSEQVEEKTTPVALDDSPISPGSIPGEHNPIAVEGSSLFINEDEDKHKGLSKTDTMMQQVKDAGIAGVISYASWEIAFWTVSVPVCVFGYREVTGHWPDFSNSDDMQKLAAEAFAFVNFARFAVPLRIGLALSTTPWVEENVVERFLKNKKDEDTESDSAST